MEQEGIAVGRTFAALKNYHVDGNKEMIAIGLMNVVGSATSCYVTTGAFSRSAVNNNAGAKTAVSNIVMSVTVMVTLLFLMPLFEYTPNVVLGAIIVTAVIGLIDLPAACQIWKIDKFDFFVMLCAFFGVIFLSVQNGLAIAVGLSLFKILMQVTRPKMVIMGNIPGTDIYRDLHHYKEAQRIPGFLVLSIESPVNFANSNYLTERLAVNYDSFLYDYIQFGSSDTLDFDLLKENEPRCLLNCNGKWNLNYYTRTTFLNNYVALIYNILTFSAFVLHKKFIEHLVGLKNAKKRKLKRSILDFSS